jgi:hypothetical protein
MVGHILGGVALLAVVSAGATVWLVVRDERGRSRSSSARALRRLTGASALVVLATIAFLRPWYWDLSMAAVVVAAFLVVHVLLRGLEHRSSPAGWGAIATALAAVVVASGLVTLGGTAAVLDGATFAGGNPAPVMHDHQVLARPVLYQVFWGQAWTGTGSSSALTQAVAFQRTLGRSPWAAAVVRAGFGVGSFSSGGCWVDLKAPTATAAASSTSSGPFPDELHRVFGGRAEVVPCPGLPATAVPKQLPPDALVALWLSPDVPYGLGGVSAHGVVPWPGRPDGLPATGITGAFASWGTPSCVAHAACRALLAYATPTYALSHEVVETVANPFGHGWFADAPMKWAAHYFLSHGPTSLLGTAPVFQGEVADLCVPGQAQAPARRPTETLGSLRLAVAAFYRPGTGCVS